MTLSEVTRAEVVRAIEEHDRLGRGEFLRRYGFAPARTYLLRYEGRLYDSKAVLGAAHGFLPGRAPLGRADFSGGASHTVRILRGLGFEVVAADGSPGPERAPRDGARGEAAPDARHGAGTSVGEDARHEAGASVGEDALLARVTGLRVGATPAGPSLHQPLTLLWGIGRAHHGGERLLPWNETEDRLGRILAAYGRPGQRDRADYPVAALHRAGLWDVDVEGPVPTAHGDAGLRQWFAGRRPDNGLTATAHALVRRSGLARIRIVSHLLDTYFDDLDDHAPLLRAVGLDGDGLADDLAPGSPARPGTAGTGTGAEATGTDDGTAGTTTDAGTGAGDPPAYETAPPHDPVVLAARYEHLCRLVEDRELERRDGRAPRTRNTPVRSAAARRAVLDRSAGRCENPGCAGQPVDTTDRGQPILEVDHVDPLGSGGRDHPSVMVALCPNCHAVKTRGSTRDALARTLLAVAAARHRATLTRLSRPSS
ncbi:HNH endonuclease [Streptomyces sp. JNUCC 64]